jgi:hypothetical protein
MGSSLPNQAQRPVRPLTLPSTFLFQITQDIEITTCYHARSSAALAWLLSFCCVPLPRKNSSRLQSLSRQKDAVSVAVHVASVSFVKCGAVAFALGPEGMSSHHSQREREREARGPVRSRVCLRDAQMARGWEHGKGCWAGVACDFYRTKPTTVTCLFALLCFRPTRMRVCVAWSGWSGHYCLLFSPRILTDTRRLWTDGET